MGSNISAAKSIAVFVKWGVASFPVCCQLILGFYFEKWDPNLTLKHIQSNSVITNSRGPAKTVRRNRDTL